VKSDARASLSPFLGFTEAIVVLGSVNLLFAFFVGIQLRYFFGGQANIHLLGYTYAEYARRGFGELVVVALLSLLLYLGLVALAKRENPAQRWIFSAMGIALVALIAVILASAFQRLALYEGAYGFTGLRTYTHIFMIWLGILLLAVVGLEIAGVRRFFPLAALLAGLGFGVTLNLLDVDAFIVWQNVARGGGLPAGQRLPGQAVSDATPRWRGLISAQECPRIGRGCLRDCPRIPGTNWERSWPAGRDGSPIKEPYPGRLLISRDSAGRRCAACRGAERIPGSQGRVWAVDCTGERCGTLLRPGHCGLKTRAGWFPSSTGEQRLGRGCFVAKNAPRSDIFLSCERTNRFLLDGSLAGGRLAWAGESGSSPQKGSAMPDNPSKVPVLRDLGDGLVLRQATLADAEALVAFNLGIHTHDDSGEPDERVGV
jgi:hypothetical protein